MTVQTLIRCLSNPVLASHCIILWYKVYDIIVIISIFFNGIMVSKVKHGGCMLVSDQDTYDI